MSTKLHNGFSMFYMTTEANFPAEAEAWSSLKAEVEAKVAMAGRDKEFAGLHGLVLTIGKGNAKRGIKKIMSAMGAVVVTV